MAANTAPIFVLTPVEASAVISAANTGRDGTGTIVDVATGGTNGTRLDKVRVKATVTTTAGMVRLFYHDGTAYRLWTEISVNAVTPSATVQAFVAELTRSDGLPLLLLPSGKKLAASTEKAEAFNVTAEGGDY